MFRVQGAKALLLDDVRLLVIESYEYLMTLLFFGKQAAPKPSFDDRYVLPTGPEPLNPKPNMTPIILVSIFFSFIPILPHSADI